MQQILVDDLPKLLEFFGRSSEFEAHLKVNIVRPITIISQTPNI